MLALTGMLAACDSNLSPQNSFIDQSELAKAKDGLIVPILDHLNQQDKGVGDQFAHAQKVTADDLIVNSSDYVIGKNDLLSVSITDLVGPGIESVRQVRVTESGKISMPLVPPISAANLTEAQLQDAIVAAYRDANLISNAQVSVTVAEARARTFTISGAISAPGEYSIVRSDFRLLDALALAHEVTSTTGVDTLYVIRRNSATSGAAASPAGAGMAPMPASAPTTTPGVDPLAPHSQAPAPVTHVMSMMVMADDATTTPAVGAMPAPPSMDSTAAPATSMPAATGDMAAMPATAPSMAPAMAGGTMASPTTMGSDQEGRYVIIDGKPVMVDRTGTPAVATTMENSSMASTAGTGTGDFEFNAPMEPTDERIIKVPVNDLRRGELKYNIVVRPGDYIYIPQPSIGEYYMGGHILRTGVYSLTARKITLKEAFISAGMLDPVAIPARTQIIRRIDDSREIFAVVDIEKIFAGTEPDLILRPDDQVIVGTNIIAPFLAALRNGFRITYGFGFLYDRNYYTGNNNNGL